MTLFLCDKNARRTPETQQREKWDRITLISHAHMYLASTLIQTTPAVMRLPLTVDNFITDLNVRLPRDSP